MPRPAILDAVTIDPARAAAHLRAADPILAPVVDALGPLELRPVRDSSFEALCRSIVYQQLSGRAAGTIFQRFRALYVPDGTGFPAPEQVLATPPEMLRSAGLSRQKIASLLSLAEHFATGELAEQSFEHWPDEEIIAHLQRVRGIGRWTAEMFLIFQLRRPDVLPVNDLGINRAIMKRYGLPAMPDPATVRSTGQPWHPHASVACLYLWRSEDVRLPG
ncbi:DNA-3-methyladenine glycosylase [Tepidiforma sp.]|uniref:DNA-3-methyladenine glycosylase family protein n=1 Tax=Tepidiforma sp. TaxID=2682230 RepID=UPI002ADDFA11|nr:DNA-3-methyladenine glycosylase [Tepidiforma sp.]